MSFSKLEKKLFVAAREIQVSDAVPYLFSKRVMTKLAAGKAVDQWSWWAGALWRAAAPCVGVMIVFSAWAYYESNSRGYDLSQDFDNTVLAVVQQEQSTDNTW